MGELCDSASYSSPRSLGVPWTASDNDVTFLVMGVSADGGGRVESADVSTQRGDNTSSQLNL